MDRLQQHVFFYGSADKDIPGSNRSQICRIILYYRMLMVFVEHVVELFSHIALMLIEDELNYLQR